jgi:hypothetical protein
MTGNHSRHKGSRAELALAHLLHEQGFAAEKVSRTGFSGPDLSITLLGRNHKTEVKVRSRGFQQLYEWLENAELLIVKGDRRELLVICRLRFGIELAKAAENSRTIETGGPHV